MKASKVTKKPWGEFRQFTLNQKSTVKTLTIKQGGELSLQTHKERREYWFILQGHPHITKGNDVFQAVPHQEIFIEEGQVHRIAALQDDVIILEIAFGHFDEADIIRLEDKYNR